MAIKSKHPAFHIAVEIENVSDDVREFPVKDAAGVPTDKTVKHRIVTAVGIIKSIDGKRTHNVSLKWFNPPVGTELPVEDKVFYVDEFRSINMAETGAYTISL